MLKSQLAASSGPNQHSSSRLRRGTLGALILAASLGLSACQSSEEKAEDFYQSGLELLAAGDEERALIQFRNVFDYNGFHLEARKTYADILLKRGEVQEAYGQYLRLIEQYPDTVPVRQTLAETAFDLGDWTEVELHGRAAIALAPEDPRSKAIAIALAYREATLARNTADQEKLAAEASALVAVHPENPLARRVIIDRLMTGPTPEAAAPEIDAALALDPDSFVLNSMKLNILSRDVTTDAFGAQLQKMVDLFPANADLKQALISWYMSNGDADKAETFLRAEAARDGAGLPERISVVQFLSAVRGREQARAELDRLIAAAPEAPETAVYRSLLATMDFEEGKVNEAIAAMDSILNDAPRTDQTRDIEVIFADILAQSGQQDRSDALIAKILTEDPSNVGALKIRASRAIATDRIGDAIVDLRAAQDQAPQDAEIMALLATAFQRDGSLDLAGEQLANAVRASGSAPEQSLRYAAFLRSQGRSGVAETVLTDARRVSPDNPAILLALAELAVEAGNWAAAQNIATNLRQLELPETQQAAQQVQAAILLGQNRIDEGLELLADQASAGEGDIRALSLLISAQLRNGKTEEAQSLLTAELSKSPDSPDLRLIQAQVDAILGRSAEAEATLRALMTEAPEAEAPARLLFGLLLGEGRVDEADATLTAALAAQPESATLLWMQAGRLEARDDFEGAISIYERLYAQNSADPIIANNLASMLSTYRSDPESLDRAATIARRLRDTTVPAFQDTYGWIAYRRGDLQEALTYLEPAASALANDPVVQFHLGRLYADLGRNDEAKVQFQRALDLGGERKLPQLEEAQVLLEQLGNAAQVPQPASP